MTGNSQINLLSSTRIDLRGVEGLQLVESLLDAVVQVINRLLVVLEEGGLGAGQATDGDLDGLGGVLHLEAEGQLVLNQAVLDVGVDVLVLLLGVLLGLGQNVVEGVQSADQHRDDGIVESERGHFL